MCLEKKLGKLEPMFVRELLLVSTPTCPGEVRSRLIPIVDSESMSTVRDVDREGTGDRVRPGTDLKSSTDVTT